MSRFTAATGLVLLVTTALVGCTPAAEREPEWTEESAYAAAEETFRAYWELSLSGADREAEAKYVTGDMSAIYDDAQADPAELPESRGEAKVTSFRADVFRIVGDSAAVEATACIDAGTYELRAESGEWYSPRDKDHYGVALRFVDVDHQMLVEDLEIAENAEC